MNPHPRSSTYYWKCDRPAAFHGTNERKRDDAGMQVQLLDVLRSAFRGKTIRLRPTPSQGNHLTFVAEMDGLEHFVRVEDGPEQDDYIEVESHLIEKVRSLGIPAPRVHAVDASRRAVPFAWQVMDRIDAPDLNQHYKNGTLDLPTVADKIGAAVAQWQNIQPIGFGPFDPQVLRAEGRLQGFHATYADYFHLHLDRHLSFLTERSFLSSERAGEIRREIEVHRSLLELPQGFLVHKDLALWNILGTTSEIAAFIDWDDAISGDPMDDLSLLACFHDAATLGLVFKGYGSVRPLPEEYRRRFWLHLLRNMIVKAVIRVGAGYFERDDGFFLIGSGGGAALKTFTHERLAAALQGMRNDAPIDQL